MGHQVEKLKCTLVCNSDVSVKAAMALFAKHITVTCTSTLYVAPTVAVHRYPWGAYIADGYHILIRSMPHVV